MKHIYLFIAVLFLFACSKEETFGPYNLKNGQEVELSVDHRYGAINDPLLILPQNKPADLSLSGFSDRKPGYMYKVKAKVHVEKIPLMDGPDKWFEFIKIIKEEKYLGSEPFEIQLIKSYVPGGPSISLGKTNEQYNYIADKIILTYTNQTVKDQLEEIYQHNLEIRKSWETTTPIVIPKWKAIKATVTHDPASFGKAYLVQHIEFTL